METVMATLAHTTPIRRNSAITPAIGRFWKAVQATISRAFYGIAAAIYVSRSKRVNREIAQHFANRGTALTDAAEREIAQRFMSSGWLRR
jgi:hypothetical protein